MENIEFLLAQISQNTDCEVSRRANPIVVKLNYKLPDDLQYYLNNYNYINLFISSKYSFKIIGEEDFKRANPVILGEDAKDDISYNWFIVATNERSQYITIDLEEKRLGKCYDSFWDRYSLVGDQPIIANSFSDLLKKMFDNKGEYYYWLKDNFDSLGDAYDE
jgi:hypothetical protein